MSVKSTFPPFSISSFLTVGSYLSASFSAGVSAFATVFVASSDGFFPSTVATAFITSFSFGSFPAGTFAVQFPSPSAVVSTFVPSGSSTTTLAFGSDVPVIVLSPAFGSVIVGVAVFSAGVLSVTVTTT